MPTLTCPRPRVAFAVSLLLATALFTLVGCAPAEDSMSKREYLALVREWFERDTAIREEALAATTEEGDETFVKLKAQVDELRTDVERVEPPEGFEVLHTNFVECEEHFSAALELLGKGEDILAIDELALSKEARLRMQEELEQRDAEGI